MREDAGQTESTPGEDAGQTNQPPGRLPPCPEVSASDGSGNFEKYRSRQATNLPALDG
jgi:hypothetical protein